MNIYTSSVFEIKDDNLKNKFTETYVKGYWADGETRSGTGSTLLYTESFRANLVRIIKDHKIKTIFDCSCGDWNWMKEISENFEDYTGNDIVEELVKVNNEKFGNERIKFICGDMVQSLKTLRDRSIDLVICRHTLEHLTNDYGVLVLTEIKRVAKIAIISSSNREDNSFANCLINVNGNSSRQICLELAPFVEILGPPESIFWDSRGVPPTPRELALITGNVYKFTGQ